MVEKLLDSKLLATSWKVRFFEDRMRSSGGKVHCYARFEVPDFALAVAVREKDGKIPLVRQHRHGARMAFWEFPAGLVETRERLVDCMKREFREETGFELEAPRLVSSVFTSPSRTGQRAHIFFGHVGKKSGQHLDETEELSIKFANMEEAWYLLKKKASSTHLLAYLLTRRHGFL